VPTPPAALVSCHLERPLDDEAWTRFDAFQQRRPGGFAVLALMRPPDAAFGEDEELWLRRARLVASRGPFGLHTHWTSPTHAAPTAGDPAERVRAELAWLGERGLEPRYFGGGAWYSDASVSAVVRELGLFDCTPREGLPSDDVLPTTHSIGALCRDVALPRLPAYVHAYFHDYDLCGARRRYALGAALGLLGRRRPRAAL
jgi:hypothetical protein